MLNAYNRPCLVFHNNYNVISLVSAESDYLCIIFFKIWISSHKFYSKKIIKNHKNISVMGVSFSIPFKK